LSSSIITLLTISHLLWINWWDAKRVRRSLGGKKGRKAMGDIHNNKSNWEDYRISYST
jgi:hypothetical protein